MARGTLTILASLLALAVAPAHAGAPLFGFNDNTTLRQQFTPAQDADLLARAGANSMRIVVDWTWVERQQGALDLSLYDPIYEAMLARGIRPLLNVMGSPKWAWTKWTLCFPVEDCHVAPDRAHNAAWGNFVRQVALRFPRAAAIEIWNEPNLRLFFRPAPNAQRYTELLRIGRDAVRSADPAMPVIGGALAAVLGDSSSSAVGLRPFLWGMYANGARGLMDGLSVHPYPGGRGPAGIYDAIDATIETRDTAQDDTPLWITETGASTTGDYSESAQAAVLGDIVPRLLRRPGVAGVYLHTLADPSERTFTIEDGYGIVRSSGTPKPAFCTLTAVFGEPECTGPVAGPRTTARWDAQEHLQSAAESALAWRRQSGAYVGYVSGSVPPDVEATPGPAADPASIAVLAVPGRPTALRLCNASTDTRSYCLTLVPGGPWQFTSLNGSIAETVAATDAGTASSW